MTSCNYIVNTEYDVLVQKGFELLYPTLYGTVTQIIDHERVGDPQVTLRQNVNNLYYELYRLVEWRVWLDNYLKSCDIRCLTKEMIEKSKEKFLINCPLICSNPKSLELIALFEESIPECGVSKYKWLGDGVCDLGNLVYNILEIIVDGVRRTVIVPTNADLNYYIGLGIPTATAQRLIDTRVIQVNSSSCCPYTVVNTPLLSISTVAPVTLILSYNLNNDSLPGVLTYNGITITLNEIEGFVTIPNVTPATSYTFTLTVTNCAGTNSTTISVTTPPYTINIVLGNNLVGNFNLLNGLQIGVNNIVNYCQSVTISWLGINQLQGITVFNVNQQDKLSEVQWTQVVSNTNVGGSWTIPCVDRNYLIFIDGERLINCGLVNTLLSNDIITISI